MKFLTCTFLAFGLTLAAAEENDTVKRLQASATVLDEVMKVADKGIPQELLDRAECIAVLPNVTKAAFIVGGRFGKGFISCRNTNGRTWGPPAGLRMEGGSVGFQAGVSFMDLVLLIMDRSGAERLVKSEFTLGGDVSVAAGPIGRDSSAQTDALMSAKILSYSRARGVFGGIALQGGTLRQDMDANVDLYGKEARNEDILFGRRKTYPAAAETFLATLRSHAEPKARPAN